MKMHDGKSAVSFNVPEDAGTGDTPVPPRRRQVEHDNVAEQVEYTLHAMGRCIGPERPSVKLGPT